MKSNAELISRASEALALLGSTTRGPNRYVEQKVNTPRYLGGIFREIMEAAKKTGH